MNLLTVVLFIAILTTAYAAFNYVQVVSLDEGTVQMSEIALAIRNGANTFLASEYKVLAVVLTVLFLLFATFYLFQVLLHFCLVL